MFKKVYIDVDILKFNRYYELVKKQNQTKTKRKKQGEPMKKQVTAF